MKNKEITTRKNCAACSMIAAGVKSRKTLPHTCINSDLFSKEFFNWEVEHGIVYVEDPQTGHYTAWLEKRPGIIVQSEKKEDIHFKIKEILDSIEGWEK